MTHVPTRRRIAAYAGWGLAIAVLGGVVHSSTAHPVKAAGGDGRAAATAVAVASHPKGDYSVYDLPSAWHDQTGAPRRLASLRGKIRVVAMIYTSCSASCPFIVQAMKRVESTLPRDGRDRVGFVLVSLDPGRDTPGELRAYAREAGLAPDHWTLLTGSDSDVRDLAITLGVRYRSLSPTELAHSNAVTVLDTAGVIVAQEPGVAGAAPLTSRAVHDLLRTRVSPREAARR